jgi:hypothetical protein
VPLIHLPELRKFTLDNSVVCGSIVLLDLLSCRKRVFQSCGSTTNATAGSFLSGKSLPILARPRQLRRKAVRPLAAHCAIEQGGLDRVWCSPIPG